LSKNNRYRAIRLETMLRPGPKIETKHIERLEVRFKKRNGSKGKFDVLMGPYPFNDPSAEAKAKYKNPIGRMVCEAGWIYASGECPYVETNLVEATAHGTTIIVQIDSTTPGTTIHRVYLLNASGQEKVKVTPRNEPGVPPPPPPISWNASDYPDDDSYLDVYPGIPATPGNPGTPITVSGPYALPSGNPNFGFVEYVVDQAELAEISP
jgi:hypothetical protein